MIVGIGCDLTEIYRVKKALTIEKFAARVFSPAEQEYFIHHTDPRTFGRNKTTHLRQQGNQRSLA
mgnify:CR=1 FL=1